MGDASASTTVHLRKLSSPQITIVVTPEPKTTAPKPCQPVPTALHPLLYCLLGCCVGLMSAVSALRWGCWGPTSTLKSDCSRVVRYDSASEGEQRGGDKHKRGSV
jgi:hypothetical protein